MALEAAAIADEPITGPVKDPPTVFNIKSASIAIEVATLSLKGEEVGMGLYSITLDAPLDDKSRSDLEAAVKTILRLNSRIL